MLTLNNLKPTDGSRKKSKKLGRGNGSGKGTFCGKGCKGQNARGSKMGARFEGGQTPLFRRLPKLRGFSNDLFKTQYNIVNLKDLENLAGLGITEITKEILIEKGIIRKKKLGIKLLGNGEIKNKISISVDKVSKNAKESIEKLGGSVKIIEISK